MADIENTTFSGVGKDFGYFPCEVDRPLVDYKGRKVIRGEEYYIFDADECAVLVHIEDVRGYLNDERLDVGCYERLIHLVEMYHDNYPVKYSAIIAQEVYYDKF